MDIHEGYMKDSGIRIRVEEELRVAFLEACRREDQTAAQVIRGFMRTYVEERRTKAQSEIFSRYPSPDKSKS